jgi:D-alanyl-D-alanine carboxypeptidase/D-alanyl-D-alanine-endopeptidase (penicillin-binding protein 4)
MGTFSQNRPGRHPPVALLSAALAAASCAGGPASRPAGAASRVPGAQAPVHAPLPAGLAALERAGAVVSVLVTDARGNVLWAHQEETLVTPASTLKVATCAALLDVADPQQHLQTELRGAAPDATGTVSGGLWLVGGGDPSFGSARWALPLQDSAPADGVLDAWADALWRRGVRTVSGDVVGDGRVLDTPGLPAGWAVDDLPYGYSAPPGGLTYLESVVSLRAVDMPDGLSVMLAPPTALVTLEPQRQTGGRAEVVMVPTLAAPLVQLSVRGPWGASQEGSVSVPDPTLFAAEQLHRALTGAGIRVHGRVRVATRSEGPPPSAVLARQEGPTLRQLCGLTLQQSLNMHAEVLLMHAGRLSGAGASTAGGLTAVKNALQLAGRDPARVRLVDGSGLSRMNLLAAADLVALLRRAVQVRPEFVQLLAQAGGRGTLRERFWGVHGQERIWGKSGSLTGHRNLVGVLQRPDGNPWFFAVMVHGTTQKRVLVDAAVEAFLAELLEVPALPPPRPAAPQVSQRR